MEKSDLQNNEIDLLIISHLTGSATEGDLMKLDKWINVSNENQNHFNNFKNAWILSGIRNSESTGYTEESWDKLKNKLSQNRFRLGSGVGSGSREKVNFNKFLKRAASWLLIFVLGSSVTWWFTGRPKETKPDYQDRITEISTPLGARSMIKLPDSTIVWLNAGTTLTYSQDYGKQSRILNLSGEAYFKVAKDSLNPFIVNTQGIIIRALGTSFNVKSYPEEESISATLEEGRIYVHVLSMTDNNAKIMLKPKEKLIYHKETNETAKYIESTDAQFKATHNQIFKPKDINLITNVRTELYTSWKDPRWIIYREPLSTLAPMLERRYNLKIIFNDDQIKKYKFTGIIENETVDQIFNALKMTAPLDYDITKDTIRLTLDISSKEAFKRTMNKK